MTEDIREYLYQAFLIGKNDGDEQMIESYMEKVGRR